MRPLSPIAVLRAGLRGVVRLALCLIVLTRCWSAGAPVSREYDVKAVFLFNFLQFVEWPSHAFPGPETHYVIGILGADPFDGAIDEVVRKETVNNRRVTVQRYLRVDDIQECHILFISTAEEMRWFRIFSLLKNRPILTVSEIEGFAHRGGMIGFHTESAKVRLRINNDAARASGLRISSKLLRIADVVSTNSVY